MQDGGPNLTVGDYEGFSVHIKPLLAVGTMEVLSVITYIYVCMMTILPSLRGPYFQ